MASTTILTMINAMTQMTSMAATTPLNNSQIRWRHYRHAATMLALPETMCGQTGNDGNSNADDIRNHNRHIDKVRHTT